MGSNGIASYGRANQVKNIAQVICEISSFLVLVLCIYTGLLRRFRCYLQCHFRKHPGFIKEGACSLHLA